MNWLTKLLRCLAKSVQTLLPTCRDATRLQSEALDHPLSLARRVGLQLHVLMCKWCRRYGEQIAFLHSAAHDCQEKDPTLPSQPLSPAARERIKKRLFAENNS